MSASKIATWVTIAAGVIAIYAYLKSRKSACSGCSAPGSLASTTPYVDYQ